MVRRYMAPSLKTKRSRLYKGEAQPAPQPRRVTRQEARKARRRIYRLNRKAIVAGFNEARRVMEEEGYKQ